MFTGNIHWNQCGQDWGPVSSLSFCQLHLETIIVSFKWLWALRGLSTLPYSLPAPQRAGAVPPSCQSCSLPTKSPSWENVHTSKDRSSWPIESDSCCCLLLKGLTGASGVKGVVGISGQQPFSVLVLVYRDSASMSRGHWKHYTDAE